jgi:hypothetical protein
MFGWKKTPPIRTLIGEGTVITGEIRFTDGLRIDGELRPLRTEDKPGLKLAASTTGAPAERPSGLPLQSQAQKN